MKRDEAIKLFGLNNLSIESELRRIENSFGVDLGHTRSRDQKLDDEYYPQFPQSLRNEASEMSRHYAVFYCLENSIREIICQRLEEAHGENWWDVAVPENVRRNAEGNRKKEIGTGFTPRSPDLIDYSNFGELGEIIKANWGIFGDTFRDIRAVEKVLGTLNTLRAPIAHCKALEEDEVVRLHLTLRDWFRQME